jgi:hypothetical protein
LRVGDEPPWLVQVELQASWDGTLPRRVLKYNVLLHDRHELPVHSVVVLLRPEADHPGLTGSYLYQSPRGAGRVEISYQVLRVWRMPVEAFLSGGLGTLPLAPLADVSREALPAVIQRMGERLRAEGEPSQVAQVWTAAYLLMGCDTRRNSLSSSYQESLRWKNQRRIKRSLPRGNCEADFRKRGRC